MKRTSQLIFNIALLAAIGVFAQGAYADGVSTSGTQPKKRNGGGGCSPNSDGCYGCNGTVANCTCGGGLVRRAIRHGIRNVQRNGHSGQPFIDPYARADWIAAHRAAVRSWHAGYYHTAWGQPVALMMPPTARMHTRWGWGVAQSTMHPLYHQYERPYPGPVAGDGTAATTLPLLPTPRWPSHTDQFGVYYVRGPW